MRAERRLGELMEAQKDTVRVNRGERGQFKSGGFSDNPPEAPPSPAEAGIDKVIEWITEMETLQAAGLSSDEIAETLKDRFPVSGAGVERLLQLHRDGLVKVAGKGA